MKIYVINLERSAGRRLAMQSQFDRLELPFEFINAVDGGAVETKRLAEVYGKWRTRFCLGRDLTRGEIGCALSHVLFYREISRSGCSGFVFEDDVELSDLAAPALAEIESFLAGSKTPCLVRLPGLERDLPRDASGSGMPGFVKVPSAMGTYAYGVNPAAADLLLKAFAPISFAIDDYRRLVDFYGLDLYVYGTRVVSVDTKTKSTIGNDRFSPKRGLGSLICKFCRVLGIAADRARAWRSLAGLSRARSERPI